MDTLIRTGSDGPARDGHPSRQRQPAQGEAVVIVDVDQFAAIRAAHGAMAAEQVTRAVAECLRRRLRTGDRLALLREDEFLAVLTGASECSAQAIAGRMREGIEGLRLALSGRIWSLSCTIGAAARTTRPCGLESLVRAADTELHRARRAGPLRQAS